MENSVSIDSRAGLVERTIYVLVRLKWKDRRDPINRALLKICFRELREIRREKKN